MSTVITVTTTDESTTGSVSLQTADVHDEEWSYTSVNYYKDADTPPPDTLNSTLSEHEMRAIRRSDTSPNIAPTAVRIRNIRGHESDFSFEQQGFIIGHEVKRVYFPEVAALLKLVTGCQDVVSYEHHVRADTLEKALVKDSTGKGDIDGPVRRVHIDESPWSARNEYDYYVQPKLPGNEHLKGRRFAIYNVWKPLKTIRKDPLCLCDQRTVVDEDLQLGKVTAPNVGEIQNTAVRPPKKAGIHDFVYLRGQRPDEAYVFRIYDSRLDGGLDGSRVEESGKRSHGVPHTSFVDPGTENEAPRESVEVRSFCIF